MENIILLLYKPEVYEIDFVEKTFKFCFFKIKLNSKKVLQFFTLTMAVFVQILQIIGDLKLIIVYP